MTSSPWYPTTCRVATGERVITRSRAAHRYKPVNAASSRFHFDPPIRSGISGARVRQYLKSSEGGMRVVALYLTLLWDWRADQGC